MGYIKSAALEETGYVVLDRYNKEIDPKEWLDIEYVDWKSSGDTRFAPLASAFGDIECNGFWNHKPPRTDKDGVFIPSQVEKAPTLTARAQEPVQDHFRGEDFASLLDYLQSLAKAAHGA